MMAHSPWSSCGCIGGGGVEGGEGGEDGGKGGEDGGALSRRNVSV